MLRKPYICLHDLNISLSFKGFLDPMKLRPRHVVIVTRDHIESLKRSLPGMKRNGGYDTASILTFEIESPSHKAPFKAI